VQTGSSGSRRSISVRAHMVHLGDPESLKVRTNPTEYDCQPAVADERGSTFGSISHAAERSDDGHRRAHPGLGRDDVKPRSRVFELLETGFPVRDRQAEKTAMGPSRLEHDRGRPSWIRGPRVSGRRFYRAAPLRHRGQHFASAAGGEQDQERGEDGAHFGKRIVFGCVLGTQVIVVTK
jgi:hypothetical protein